MRHILILFVLLLLWGQNPVQGQEYRLSMQPLFASEQMEAMLEPLAAKLREETGYPVHVLLSDNAADYEIQVLRNRILLGYQSAAMYVQISQRHEVLATAVQGKGQGRGLIILPRGSEIKEEADLKGKRLMIVSRHSSGGFLSQKQTLREQGLDIEKESELIEAAAQLEENVLIAVSLGEVDAGFISESALHKADEYILPDSVVPFMKTAPLPHWVFSVSRRMPEEQKEDIRETLLALQAQDPVLKALGITAFQEASDADYDIIRSLLQ
jgi:phosphonate transport system substrate-binding protein